MYPRVKTALTIACVLGLQTAPTHARPKRTGIKADLAAAHLVEEIDAVGAKSTRLEQEEEGLLAKASNLRASTRQKIRGLYRTTRAGTAPLAGGIDAVRRHVALVSHLKRMLRSELDDLKSAESRLKSIQSEKAQTLSALSSARSQLSAAQSHRGAGELPPGALHQRSRHDSSRLAQASGKEFYGIRVVGDNPSNSGFGSLRGRLASPVTGSFVVQNSKRRESNGSGLEFGAPTGTAVRAVSSGRVAFSDVYGSYGRLVILDHDDGYYTVYGGLGTVEVRVGDDLSKRARLGSVGTHAGKTALYFEVRKGTRALPPRSWLGI